MSSTVKSPTVNRCHTHAHTRTGDLERIRWRYYQELYDLKREGITKKEQYKERCRERDLEREM
jgi:hypothetical protein